ncbi:hypothetical protein [Phaffia rhodozyma]|uniref:PLOD1-3-like GT domain-containing protein n=1 Tax=Phaffia rhodozyma TaxID=264483 RepID=A0A0F7SIX2_PHARH|nr:hypothetical protein [Phaffia rhodozyma]
MTTMLLGRAKKVLLSYGIATTLSLLFFFALSPYSPNEIFSRPFNLPSVAFLSPHDRPIKSSPKSVDEVDIHLLIPLSDVPSLEPVSVRAEPAPYCRTVLTSLLRGYTPILLDLGNQMTWEEGTSLKINVVASYLERLAAAKSKKEQMVLMIDGWDVWMQLGPEELVRRYYDSNQGIILGADKMCWPAPPDLPQACKDVPTSPFTAELYQSREASARGFTLPYTSEQKAISQSPPRFPNSGTLLSTSTTLSSLYEHFVTHPISPHPIAPGLASVPPNDQERFVETFYTDHLSAQWRIATGFGLNVDYATEFFGTTLYALSDYVLNTGSAESTERWPVDEEKKEEEERQDKMSLEKAEIAHQGLFSNRITGQTPIAMHFNGKEGKEAAKIIWREMEWIQNRTVRETFEQKSGATKGVWVGEVGGRWLEWDKLGCQGIWETI